MILRTAIGIALVIASGCAGRPATGTIAAAPARASAVKEGCQAIDSSFTLGSPVYRECAVERKARVRGREPQPDFSPAPPSRECYSVTIAMVVDENGLPVAETARVVRSTDTQFAQAVLNTVPDWRFTPARKDGIAVKQVVEIDKAVMTFVVTRGQPTTRRRPTRATC